MKKKKKEKKKKKKKKKLKTPLSPQKGNENSSRHCTPHDLQTGSRPGVLGQVADVGVDVFSQVGALDLTHGVTERFSAKGTCPCHTPCP